MHCREPSAEELETTGEYIPEEGVGEEQRGVDDSADHEDIVEGGATQHTIAKWAGVRQRPQTWSFRPRLPRRSRQLQQLPRLRLRDLPLPLLLLPQRWLRLGPSFALHLAFQAAQGWREISHLGPNNKRLRNTPPMHRTSASQSR